MWRSILAVGTCLAAGCATAGEGPKPNLVVRSGEGAALVNPFHPIEVLLSHDDSEGEVTLLQFDLPPGSAGSPPHTHTLEDEYFFVLSGTLDVLSGDETLELGPGDFAALNRGHLHMFWNGGEAPVRLLMATTGASFEAFMRSVAPTLAETALADARAAGETIGRLAAEHGIAIDMSALPPEAAPFYAP